MCPWAHTRQTDIKIPLIHYFHLLFHLLYITLYIFFNVRVQKKRIDPRGWKEYYISLCAYISCFIKVILTSFIKNPLKRFIYKLSYNHVEYSNSIICCEARRLKVNLICMCSVTHVFKYFSSQFFFLNRQIEEKT